MIKNLTMCNVVTPTASWSQARKSIFRLYLGKYEKLAFNIVQLINT